MSYSVISSRRMPYDIDGTVVGRQTSGSYTKVIDEWVTDQNVQEMNDDDRVTILSGSGTNGSISSVWYFFFPEKREIENIALGLYCSYGSASTAFSIEISGSNDTTNGMDGTWEIATWPNGSPSFVLDSDDWMRINVKAVSFSGSYKVLRVKISGAAGTGYVNFYGLHLFGCKASGETLDDIVFCDSSGNEITALKDWGDRPEGTVLIDSFYLKNISSSKVANGINIQLNDRDYLISLDQSTWQATLNISSLGVGEISAPIYVKNTIGNPNQTLGPRAARAIVTVTSWSE